MRLLIALLACLLCSPCFAVTWGPYTAADSSEFEDKIELAENDWADIDSFTLYSALDAELTNMDGAVGIWNNEFDVSQQTIFSHEKWVCDHFATNEGWPSLNAYYSATDEPPTITTQKHSLYIVRPLIPIRSTPPVHRIRIPGRVGKFPGSSIPGSGSA